MPTEPPVVTVLVASDPLGLPFLLFNFSEVNSYNTNEPLCSEQFSGTYDIHSPVPPPHLVPEHLPRHHRKPVHQDVTPSFLPSRPGDHQAASISVD